MAAGSWTRDALDLASAEEWLAIPVAGRSMHPLLLDGDMAEIATRGTPAPGDVVAIRRGEDLLIHRIVRRDGERLFEMGDAELRESEVRAGELLGVAVAVRTGDGRTFRLDSRLARHHGRLAARVLGARRRGPAAIRRAVGYLVRLAALGVRLSGGREARPTRGPRVGSAGA